MTLTPETRVLLTDALRPPAGHRVEIAVGTTYSLNLTALLLAPMSFALFDETTPDNVAAVDPIRLLEAVRRHAEHTTVFCQAGGIHVPTNYRSILTFVEDSVLEVMPPRERAIFHPKLWALRFVDQDGLHRHRVVVLSRNMTLDRSWDTALVLDEDPEGTIAAAPAAEFLSRLPGLATAGVTPKRSLQIDDLVRTLAAATLAAPAPFTEGALLPIGLGDDHVWPFPKEARRVLAISPFLTNAGVAALARLTSDRTIVSRPESLDLLGADALAGWKVNALQRLAEVDPADDVSVASHALTEFQAGNEGLHAKTFVVDLVDRGAQSMTVTGSANLTTDVWGGNVEFDAMLIGPTSACGVRAVLDGSTDVPGLGQILEEYAPVGAGGLTDPAIATSYAIEWFHQQLASSLPQLHVTALDDDRVEARLTLVVTGDAPGRTSVWPVSLPKDVHELALAESLAWTLAPVNVTPFIAVETVAGDGDARVTRRCVLKATLSGAIDARRHEAVFSILRSKDDVLRYLVFLLGDPSYDALFAQLAGVDGDRFSPEATGGSSLDVALLEPLVRATGRDEDALARVASLVEELRALPNGADLVPDGFDTLWDVVWQVHSAELR